MIMGSATERGVDRGHTCTCTGPQAATPAPAPRAVFWLTLAFERLTVMFWPVDRAKTPPPSPERKLRAGEMIDRSLSRSSRSADQQQLSAWQLEHRNARRTGLT